MKYLLVTTFAVLGACAMQAQAQSGVHQGQYQKNLIFKGPITGDENIYHWRFAPRATIRKLAGKAVRLRFVLKDADLYSFCFGNSSNGGK